MNAEILAASAADLDDIRTLFREYEADLGVDLCFQGFEQELARLPGDYAPPSGRLLIARIDDGPVGCVAVRSLGGDRQVCEMKRLFVRPASRKFGIGRQLVERILAEARNAGYREMRLDTLASLTAALALYREFGFEEISAYYPNPLPDVVYLGLNLLRSSVNEPRS